MDLVLIVLILGWVFVLLWVPAIIYTKRKIHPPALFVLFGAEMWERFSFYGMRALLTLYMVKVVFADLKRGEADIYALAIYGSYTSMVNLFPVFGGLISDRIFGSRKAIIFGGSMMVLGHFTLALQGIIALEESVSMFFTALALIIIGNGFFKPNISSFLGHFYERDDPRKDAGFTIFYMGINIGAFLATLTCGYIGERINWHYGFGLAGIGMVLGLILFYLMGPVVFGDKGLPPDPVSARRPVVAGLSKNALIYGGAFLMVPVVAGFLHLDEMVSSILLFLSLSTLAYMAYSALTDKDRVRGDRLMVIVTLFIFHVVFVALFAQAGGSLTLFADRNVDRVVFGSEIPASIFQSLNPFFIILLAPLFSSMWIYLRRRRSEPSTPMKFVLGLTQLGLGFVVIVAGAQMFGQEGLVPLVFLLLMYLLHTTGELCMSPVAISMITKLSPIRLVGFTMGAWFLSSSLAYKAAGKIGELTAPRGLDLSMAAPEETLHHYLQAYITWGIFGVLGAALALFLLTPVLRRWMHGIN